MAEDYRQKLVRLTELLRQPGKHWALTGAGISTDSGIPDYRSPGTGLWEKMDPTRVASVEALEEDPVFFFRMNLPRWAKVQEALPNPGHLALARLEQEGFIQGVVTQNVDGLHLKAGSKRVYEVHGHLRTARCLSCGRSYAFAEMWDQFQRGTVPPRCRCGGMLRPDVVLFGDPMSEDYYAAARELEDCDLLLVIGTSLQVYPVAGLPRYARKLAIINLMPTPYDREAEVVIQEPISQVMGDLLQMLGIG
ncbi:MAG: SIR2 family NAD-dependent protein deacylase [Moorellales bacterium]